MKNRTKILIATLACAGVATAALAHNHGHHGGGKGPRAERMLERMDTDGDGVVSREDALAFATARFAQMDANADGSVTRDERRAERKARRGERIARLDTDGDGLISEAEMRAMATERASRRFARMDADGDGFASVAEIAAMRGERGAKHGSHHRMKHERAEGGPRGPVTQAAMEERVLKRFARLDTDNDGVVTIADLRKR